MDNWIGLRTGFSETADAYLELFGQAPGGERVRSNVSAPIVERGIPLSGDLAEKPDYHAVFGPEPVGRIKKLHVYKT